MARSDFRKNKESEDGGWEEGMGGDGGTFHNFDILSETETVRAGKEIEIVPRINKHMHLCI